MKIMIKFTGSNYFKKVVCIFVFAFLFDSLFASFSFENNTSDKSFTSSRETINFLSGIYDKDTEEEKVFFYFSAKVQLMSEFVLSDFNYLNKSKSINREIPFKQLSIPPPHFL